MGSVWDLDELSARLQCTSLDSFVATPKLFNEFFNSRNKDGMLKENTNTNQGPSKQETSNLDKNHIDRKSVV